MTGDPREQEARFKKFIEQWTRADSNGEIHVIGDMNVDMLKWDNPEQQIIPLVNMIKDNILTRGLRPTSPKRY